MQLFKGDYLLTGKHATYAEFLKDTMHIYETVYDVFINAAIVGYLYDRRADKDTTSTATKRIFAEKIIKGRDECMRIYRLITILSYKDLGEEECLNRAFRYESDDEKQDIVEECYENFEAYMRGGIEYLYEQLNQGCTSEEDYMMRSFEIVEQFYNELKNVDYDKQIAVALEEPIY